VDYEALKFWAQIVLIVWNIGMTVWAFWGNKTKELKQDITALAENVAAESAATKMRLVVHSENLARIDERLKHMPDAEELESLKGDIKALLERTRAQDDRLETIGATLRRVEDYLLNKK
jgi:uncharacterized protein HemX